MVGVRFSAFTEAEFDEYQRTAVPSYAAEHVRAGTYPAEGAVDRARAEFDKILPSGLQTPGHTVVWLLDPTTDARVGHLWYFLPAGEKRMYLYDIEIRPEFRRRGYAESAISVLGHVGRAAGATRLALHVFGHNTGAIALYEKLGFATTNRMMAKPL